MSARVLVADDDPAVRRVIARSLSALADCEVACAEDGSRVEPMLSSFRPDLLLLDLSMPGLDGWAVLRGLRERAQTRLLPVILVTGEGSESSRVEGLARGADDFVVKPFSTAELAARVKRLLERHRLDLCAQPLTGLPGNRAIEDEVGRLIQAGAPFAFCHADIDRFKSYNDRYGFARGDELIAAAARLLQDCAAETGGGLFVGHVGGDDFALAGEPGLARACAALLARRFDELAPSFYEAEDRRRGAVRVRDRRGVMRRFPIVTISIGGVSSEQRPLTHYAQAVQLAGEMKTFLKSDRRRRASRAAFDRRAS